MARARGRRTDYNWGNVGDVNEDINPGSGAVYGGTAFAFNLAGTLVRIRGRVGATLDTGAVGEMGLLLCGLTLVTADAFVTTSAPELATNASDEASWIWRGSLYLSSGSEAGVIGDNLSADLEIDSKAMRRIKASSVLAMVFEAPATVWIDQTGVIDAVYDLHILVGD